MNKNGFAFIETIITIVILSATLLYIYNSYSAIINDEKTRLYYDDVAFIYKTNYIRNFLDDYTDINSIKEYAFLNSYIETIGSGYTSMFNQNQISSMMNASLENIVQSFNVNQMILLQSKMFDDCVHETDKCNNSLESLSFGMKSYINTLNDTSYEYYLVVEYALKQEAGKTVKCTPGRDKRCVSYYASLGL